MQSATMLDGHDMHTHAHAHTYSQTICLHARTTTSNIKHNAKLFLPETSFARLRISINGKEQQSPYVNRPAHSRHIQLSVRL